MKVIRVALGLMMTVLLSFTFGPEAHASTLEYDRVVDPEGNVPSDHDFCVRARKPNNWGNACLTKYGDRIWVQDNRADGRSVSVHWRTESGRRGLCHNPYGLDIWRYQCDKDFPEDQWIEMRLGRCNGDRYNCSSLYGYRNWTKWRRTVNDG